MNTTKCKDCRFFDPIDTGRTKEPKHGWCAARSIYPTKESVGQVFPPGVKRMTDPTKPAKPVIVSANGVVVHCSEVQPK